MKKLFKKILSKVFKKVIEKSINDAVSNPDASQDISDVGPITIPSDSTKEAKWKFAIQVLISILTALAASLTTTSCVNHF